MPRLDPDIIRRDIEALMAVCPELADDEQLRHDMIEGETEAFTLLSIIVRRIGETEALAEGTKQYAAEIRERKARFDRRAEGYRSLIRKLLRHASLRKAELPEATVSLGQKPKIDLVITNEAAVPEALCRCKPEPDKTAIREALEAGADVDWAALVPGDPVLTIRTK